MLAKRSAACGGGSPATRLHWLFFLGLLASICDLWTDRAAPDHLPHPHPTAAFCAAHGLGLDHGGGTSAGCLDPMLQQYYHNIPTALPTTTTTTTTTMPGGSPPAAASS